MFGKERDQKPAVGTKWGSGFAKDRVHNPRYEERGQSFGTTKSEHDAALRVSRKLWAGNLSLHVSEILLAEQFTRFGEIESITVHPSRSSNYAFILFRKEDDAVLARRSLQGMVIAGQAMRVDFAKGDINASSSHHGDDIIKSRDDRRGGELGSSVGRDPRATGPSAELSSTERHRGDRDAEPSEVLWIGFPSFMKVDEMSLRREFEPFGEIEHITTFPGRTYAFVQFSNIMSACRAKEALQGKLFNSPRVNICFSKSEVGPMEHAKNSSNGAPPFTHKVPVNAGFGKKVGDNVRHERSHGLIPESLGLHSSDFGSHPERILGSSHFKHLEHDNSFNKFSGSNHISRYDDMRPAQIANDEGITNDYTDYHASSPIIRSPYWPGNTIEKHHGSLPPVDIWDTSADEMPIRDTKRPRFGGPKNSFETPVFEHGRDSQNFGALRGEQMTSGPENYMPRYPLSSNEDRGPLPDSGDQSVKQSRQMHGSWNAPSPFESTLTPSVPSALEPYKWEAPDANESSETDDWKWQGTIAKGGTAICRARCLPVGKVLDVALPEFLNCTARTGLDMLAKHFYQAGSVGVVFFVPETDPDMVPYNEFMHYLEEKQRAAVAKLGDGISLFLVPPCQFSEQVLKVPGRVSISGVILKFNQPIQMTSEMTTSQPQLLPNRASKPVEEDAINAKAESPSTQPRVSGYSNNFSYQESKEQLNNSSPWNSQSLPLSAGPNAYQRPSGGVHSFSSLEGTTVTDSINNTRSNNDHPQNQGAMSTWSLLNPERFPSQNPKAGNTASDRSSAQENIAFSHQGYNRPIVSETRPVGSISSIPALVTHEGQSQQSQRMAPPISTPTLQTDHLAQLASILGAGKPMQLPMMQPIQVKQEPTVQSQSGLSSIQFPSSQFTYGVQASQQPMKPPTVQSSTQGIQSQSNARDESESAAERRLQETLKLAASLLQQIQQQSRSTDQK